MITKNIAIIGLGWLGLPLAKHLMAQGYQVSGSVTTVEKQQHIAATMTGLDIHCWQAGTAAPLPLSLCAPVMIVTIPPGKLSNYAAALQQLLSQAKAAGVKHLIYMSSTSVYSGDGWCDESSPLQAETAQGAALIQTEQYLQQAGFSCWTILRPAGLFGPGRYPGRFLSGKTLDGGGRAVNLVHQTDVVGAITALLTHEQGGGVFNLAAPDHPTRAAFYTQACLLAGLALPHFSDMQNQGKLIDGSKIESVFGYHYQIRDLLAWLHATTAGE